MKKIEMQFHIHCKNTARTTSAEQIRAAKHRAASIQTELSRKKTRGFNLSRLARTKKRMQQEQSLFYKHPRKEDVHLWKEHCTSIFNGAQGQSELMQIKSFNKEVS